MLELRVKHCKGFQWLSSEDWREPCRNTTLSRIKLMTSWLKLVYDRRALVNSDFRTYTEFEL
jgi:hypothetical protein